ncbi:ubiquitin-activating E1 FCCH domain-containing protein [Pseudomonas sp. JS3066]|uniref:ubiquitin-activating E1 FCCH domain-containing protein n=1 Tax=Pseudomonas sp. JS3066 TaxID=3090665 RepID=UPI002E7B2021|nr:ubiquitin-activating E1 FCCH domain-containing protein [Pseudomonas sp. JS3066]WVK91138.1 ubiquitin-activating E1 FCCH domain-containing protein [Pseudomonas sp. JS3066]
MAIKNKAVSSQGTHFYIEDSAAVVTPLTITAITKAAQAVVSIASHGRVVGDVVKFAAVVGMTEINGLSGIVTATASGTITVNIDSTAFTTYASAGTATPVAFIETCQHKSYSGFDGQASEIDTTTMCSTAKEKMLGLQDFGGMSADLHYVEDDAFQVAAMKAKADGVARWFRLVKKNGYSKLWQGIVRSFSDSGAVDGTNSGTLAVTITGEVVEVK